MLDKCPTTEVGPRPRAFLFTNYKDKKSTLNSCLLFILKYNIPKDKGETKSLLNTILTLKLRIQKLQANCTLKILHSIQYSRRLLARHSPLLPVQAGTHAKFLLCAPSHQTLLLLNWIVPTPELLTPGENLEPGHRFCLKFAPSFLTATCPYIIRHQLLTMLFLGSTTLLTLFS